MYDRILLLLQESAVVSDTRIVELKIYGAGQFRIKIRSAVLENQEFQVWINHNPRHTRYAYQLISQSRPLLRWDNAPHHPELLENVPHHFHSPDGKILPSTLAGNPLVDLPVVLECLKGYEQ